VPELQALKSPGLKPPPVPVLVEVHASPVIGVPTQGSSIPSAPPWFPLPPDVCGAPPAPGAPPLFVEPALPGLVLEPALPVLLAPAFEAPPLLPLPAAPGLSSLELLPQAVSAASPNKTIP